MIKRLDRVKRVPLKATKYFEDILFALDAKLTELEVGSRADILITDVEKEHVHFNVEAWETFKFTLRLSDMKPVKEGKMLTLPEMGWSRDELIEKIIPDLQAWDYYIKLSASIDKSKQFIINFDTVVEYESNAPLGGGIYEVEFEKNSSKPKCMMGPWLRNHKQQWYGYNHEDALRNALEYQPSRKPVRVKFLRTEKF